MIKIKWEFIGDLDFVCFGVFSGVKLLAFTKYNFITMSKNEDFLLCVKAFFYNRKSELVKFMRKNV